MSKTINIDFSNKSIKNAINQIRNIRTKFSKCYIQDKYLLSVYNYIVSKSNEYLYASGFDNKLISEISASWEYQITSGILKMTNTHEKSVYVEFGIGIIGQGSGYPQTFNPSYYEYNIPTEYKREDGSWRFDLGDGEILDIRQQDIISEEIRDNGKTIVKTKGYPATLFVYNAIMDFQSSGMYKKLWNQVLEKELNNIDGN